MKKLNALIMSFLVVALALPMATDVSYASEGFTRIQGATRYDTSIAAADIVFECLGDFEEHDTIIVASGENYPDALTGSYLAYAAEAPILLVGASTETKIKAYIDKALGDKGTVYILGGAGAVSTRFENSIKKEGRTVKRLYGANRYDTNLEILKEALDMDAIADDYPLIVATGNGYADSLSASGAMLPILLVGDKLTAEQKELLSTQSFDDVWVLGGDSVVNDAVAAEVGDSLKNKKTPVRIYGKNRYETSVKLAEKVIDTYEYNDTSITLAYGENFPDGLSGGPVAYDNFGALVLVSDSSYKYAQDYYEKYELQYCRVMGGPALISDATVKKIIGI